MFSERNYPKSPPDRVGDSTAFMLDHLAQFIAYKNLTKKTAAFRYRRLLLQAQKYIGTSLIRANHYEIQNYLIHLSENYADQTYNLNVAAIRGFYKYWQKKTRILVDWEELKEKAVYEEIPKFYKESEFEKFRILPEDTYYWLRIKTIIFLLRDTGIRVCELCAFNLKDFDPDKKSCLISTAKNRQLRAIFWSEATHLLLLRYRLTRLKLEANSEAFFITGDTYYPYGRIKRAPVCRWLKRACKKAEVEYKANHAFRHAKAHRAIKKGANIVHVQTLLGHKDPKSTFRYLVWEQEEQEQIAMKFM